MSQDAWIILLLKIVLVCGAASAALFVAEYSWRTRGACFRNPIGRTLVWKDILLILCLLPSILSLFLSFNRLTSHIAAWVDIGLFGLLTPAMIWRVLVFEKIHREKVAAAAGEDEVTLCCDASPGAPGPSSPPFCAPTWVLASCSAATGQRKGNYTSGA